MATCVHTLVVFFLVKIRGGELGIANAVAFLAATGFSYVANTLWTFETKHSRNTLLRYLVVACIGSFFSYLLATLCTFLGFMWWMSVVLIVAIMPLLTWVAHDKWTYAR